MHYGLPLSPSDYEIYIKLVVARFLFKGVFNMHRKINFAIILYILYILLFILDTSISDFKTLEL